MVCFWVHALCGTTTAESMFMEAIFYVQYKRRKETSISQKKTGFRFSRITAMIKMNS